MDISMDVSMNMSMDISMNTSMITSMGTTAVTILGAIYRGPGILRMPIIPCAILGLGGKETHKKSVVGKT